ncbi:MAG: hypothetical protein E7320_03630 [Clostridiales bacterium]|nr:hypothetical protein [Clostridiales bacterium]
MGRLKLSNLYIGKTDGYNEFLEYGQDKCKDLFFQLSCLDVNDFLSGRRYYICGDKGTGKTMLLKYIESLVAGEPDRKFSEFIRFRRDFDEDERNQMKRAGVPQAPFEEILDRDIPSDKSIDCTLAWQVYLIKVIICRLEKFTEGGVFDRETEPWGKLQKLISLVYKESDTSDAVKRIIPKLKRGNIEIDIGKLAKIGVEFEWDSDKSRTVSFASLGKKIVELYSNLSPDECDMYVFVDELELSLKKTKNYERDITLIRDLIFAIQYMNEIAKKRGYNVYIMTAIRNEVYREVKSKGLEINKPIHDFGVQISWQQKGGDIRTQPLLRMLERRFQYSEEQMGLEITEDVFEEYFVKSVGRGNIPIRNYILDQTWLRPRDIIRFFSIIQEVANEKDFIDQETLDIVRQRYSEESWAEFEEILTVKYSDVEVSGIRQALTGLQVPFTSREFAAQIDGKAETFEEVENLKNGNRKPAHILRDLYDIGVIGNYGEVKRFAFKGDKDIDPMLPLTFHYPLLRYFKAQFQKPDKREIYV